MLVWNLTNYNKSHANRKNFTKVMQAYTEDRTDRNKVLVHNHSWNVDDTWWYYDDINNSILTFLSSDRFAQEYVPVQWGDHQSSYSSTEHPEDENISRWLELISIHGSRLKSKMCLVCCGLLHGSFVLLPLWTSFGFAVNTDVLLTFHPKLEAWFWKLADTIWG